METTISKSFFDEINLNFLQYEIFDQYLWYMYPELVFLCPLFGELKEKTEMIPTTPLFLDGFLEDSMDELILILIDPECKMNYKIENEKKEKLLKTQKYIELHRQDYFKLFEHVKNTFPILSILRCPFYIIANLLILVVLPKGGIELIHREDSCIYTKPKVVWDTYIYEPIIPILSTAFILDDFELINLIHKYFNGSMEINELFVRCLNDAKIYSKIIKFDMLKNVPRILEWGIKNLNPSFSTDQAFMFIYRDDIECYRCLIDKSTNPLLPEQISRDLSYVYNYDSLEIFKYLIHEKSCKVKKEDLRERCTQYLMSLADYQKYLDHSGSSSNKLRCIKLAINRDPIF